MVPQGNNSLGRPIRTDWPAARTTTASDISFKGVTALAYPGSNKVLLASNPAAAQHQVVLVKNRRLSGSHRALGLVQAHLDLVC